MYLVCFILRLYHDARSSECQTIDDVQLVQRTLSPGVKRPGNDATHSPPTIAYVKTSSAVTPLPLWSPHGMKKAPLPFYANEGLKSTNCPKNPNILQTLVISRYFNTVELQLIRINWDDEPSGYAENPDNFSAKIGCIGCLKFWLNYLQYIPAPEPFKHAWFEVLESITLYCTWSDNR